MDDPFTMVTEQALASATGETCTGGGGSCTYTNYFEGQPQSGCTACCPTGKTPQCNFEGCTCV